MTTTTDQVRTTATLDRSWWSWAGPHGGSVAALALQAASDLAPVGWEPRSLTAQFLAPAPEGGLVLLSRALRTGRGSAVLTASVVGADSVVDAEASAPAVTLTVTGGPARPGAYRRAGVAMPDVPPAADCAPLDIPAELVPFAQHLEVRPATPALPLAGGEAPELVAWVRLRDGRRLDAAALTVLADALPPGLYGVASVPVAVPTVDLHVAFSGEPAGSGWVLARITTRSADGAWCVDDSEVWAPDGRLLAQARQTRRVLGDVS